MSFDRIMMVLVFIVIFYYYILHRCVLNNFTSLKFNKFRDFYHTCYALSGLSIAQNGVGTQSDTGPVVYNDAKDTIMPTDPIYNVRQDKLDAAKAYFAKIGGTPSHNVLTSEELE